LNDPWHIAVNTILIRNPPLIAFVGASGSGKTTVMEYITANLTRLGFRVGVAKHIHAEGFTIDIEGKDTWRHAGAGARVVIGVSPNELAIIKKTSSETAFEEVVKEFEDQNLDVVLLEGFSSATEKWKAIPKILTARGRSDLVDTLARTQPPILAITGRVVREGARSQRSRIPYVDVMKDGPILTSMIRRLLRPNEMREMLQRVATKHGGACVGLAIGVRAAHLASSAFGLDGFSPEIIECGTKQCVAEGMKSIYPKSAINVHDGATNRIEVRSPTAKLSMQLIPKDRASFTRASQVLKAPDAKIFESIELST
jgi:molybdopterin-guanine dinucleotide biosynthesis protein B